MFEVGWVRAAYGMSSLALTRWRWGKLLLLLPPPNMGHFSPCPSSRLAATTEAHRSSAKRGRATGACIVL